MRFHVALHKEPNSIYGVAIPDLPGCFSSGKTFDEALDSAKEAIQSHIETLLELGDSVDIVPRSIEAHLKDPQYISAIWAVVEVDMSELDAKPSRFNVSMPRFVLAKIDRYAHAKHETRSGLLARAALELIERDRIDHIAA